MSLHDTRQGLHSQYLIGGDIMGRRKIWQEMRRCGICDKEFMPEFSNSVYCCKAHARIARRAKASQFGRDMLANNPAEAQAWYGDDAVQVKKIDELLEMDGMDETVRCALERARDARRR